MKKINFSIAILAIFVLFACNKTPEQTKDVVSQVSTNYPTMPDSVLQALVANANCYENELWKAILLTEMKNVTFSLTKENSQLCRTTHKIQKNNRPPDFWTCDREEFYNWVGAQLQNGNTVTITYDAELECYFGWSDPPVVTPAN